jgi:hypothetical protein
MFSFRTRARKRGQPKVTWPFRTRCRRASDAVDFRGVVTDPFPRRQKLRQLYLASDARPPLSLPPPAPVRALTAALTSALGGGDAKLVRVAAHALLEHYAAHFGVRGPSVRVLGVRPHHVEDGVCTYQLFGDYTPSTERIRVWMRTAIRAQLSSPKALLNTLLHELCHHLDNTVWACPESPHTRGFFGRIDDLYHHALATPPAARRRLHWVKVGAVYRIDWARSRTAPVRAGPSAPTDGDLG